MRSGAGGPCDHCDTISTCCWRKGPPEKPNLCNACGSRWLVKHNLDGYMPGSKPQRRAGSSVADSKAVLRKAAAMDLGYIRPIKKRQIKRKKHADWSEDDLTDFYPHSEKGVYDRPYNPTVRRTKIVHKHKNGRITVDRGTQTAPRSSVAKRSQFFAVADYQEMSEADFNSLAVATLTLLRNSPEAKDIIKDELPHRARPRKPGHGAIIRTLF